MSDPPNDNGSLLQYADQGLNSFFSGNQIRKPSEHIEVSSEAVPELSC